MLALAAILTVTTATTLVLHLRRDEMEIMRLVGATESVIRWPRLLQGMAQGLLAAIVALATLEIAYLQAYEDAAGATNDVEVTFRDGVERPGVDCLSVHVAAVCSTICALEYKASPVFP